MLSTTKLRLQRCSHLTMNREVHLISNTWLLLILWIPLEVVNMYLTFHLPWSYRSLCTHRLSTYHLKKGVQVVSNLYLLHASSHFFLGVLSFVGLVSLPAVVSWLLCSHDKIFSVPNYTELQFAPKSLHDIYKKRRKKSIISVPIIANEGLSTAFVYHSIILAK